MPCASSPIKDPWDIEHEQFLTRNPNALVHSDRFYTGVIHKGFDADTTAEELIRRYPVFEETEQHREFLVRNISERLVIPGERSDYFTPEQLWAEDDRINGRRCFTKDDVESSSDEGSVVDEPPEQSEDQKFAPETIILKSKPRGVIGEEQLESDEQLAQLFDDPVAPKHLKAKELSGSDLSEQKDMAMNDNDLAELFGEEPESLTTSTTTPEAEPESPKKNGTMVVPEDDSDLPVTLQSDGHTTIITRSYADVQRTLTSLDFLPEASVTSISHTSVDGSLVLAVLGHVKADGSAHKGASEDVNLNNAIRIDSSAIGNSNTNRQDTPIEMVPSSNEWNVLTHRPHRSTTAFLSGPQTCGALMVEISWDPDNVVASSVAYKDGRTLVLMVGERHKPKTSGFATYDKHEADPAEQFDRFFAAMRKDKDIPAEHSELVSLLQLAHKDMVQLGALSEPDPFEDASDSLEDEDDVSVTIPDDERASEIETLQKRISIVQKKLYLAKEAQKAPKTRSVSYSKDRMQQILQRPSVDHKYFSHVDSRKQRRLASQDGENRLPADAQSSQHHALPQQVSGWPADFTSNLATETAVAAPRLNPPGTNKRKRAPEEDVISAGSESNSTLVGDDDDDDDYVGRPQQRRKIATTKAKGKSKRKPKTKVKAE